MRLSIPSQAFLGIVLEWTPEEGYRLDLAHRDPDLCIPLARSSHEGDMVRQWRDYAAYFNLPRLSRDINDGLKTIESPFGLAIVRQPLRHGRGDLLRYRRSRASRRRKIPMLPQR